MEQWKNRVAIVTGASSGKTILKIILKLKTDRKLLLLTGIGAAIAKDLAKAGMITVGLARRVEQIEAIKEDLPESVKKNFHALKCDITNEEEIVKVFSLIDDKFNGIDVLINNAGILRQTALINEDNSSTIRDILNTNVLGLIYCTREAYKSMEKHGRNSHVVHINSIFGHHIICGLDVSLNMYPPSKFAVTAITEIHRQEFIRSKHHIKVTSISPGAVRTEIISADMMNEMYHGKIPLLESEDISQSVLHVLGTPPHVQIHELIIKPFGEMM